MSNSLIGVLALLGSVHCVLVVVPLVHTLRAPISAGSKIAWCLFLLLIPFIAVAIFHFRFRASLFQGKPVGISAANERARSGTLAPRDNDSNY